MAGKRRALAGLALIVLLMTMALVSMQSRAALPSESAAAPALAPVQPSQFVGAQACKSCHEAEFKAWSGSHRQLAMQAATPASVLGVFSGVKFKQKDVESTFFKRDEALAVLRRAQQQHPGNLDIVNALFSMSREAGDKPAALRYAKQLAELMPDNANLRRLIMQLEKP